MTTWLESLTIKTQHKTFIYFALESEQHSSNVLKSLKTVAFSYTPPMIWLKAQTDDPKLIFHSEFTGQLIYYSTVSMFMKAMS